MTTATTLCRFSLIARRQRRLAIGDICAAALLLGAIAGNFFFLLTI